MSGEGDLHQEVRESLGNGIWDTEEWGTDGTNVTLCLICVWFIVIYMRPESETPTQRIYSPRRTKPWGWDGASCGCHMPWTHTPWVCLAAVFRSLPCSQSKGWQSSSTPTPPGFPIFVLKLVFFLKKIHICSPFSTWYLLLLARTPPSHTCTHTLSPHMPRWPQQIDG